MLVRDLTDTLRCIADAYGGDARLCLFDPESRTCVPSRLDELVLNGRWDEDCRECWISVCESDDAQAYSHAGARLVDATADGWLGFAGDIPGDSRVSVFLFDGYDEIVFGATGLRSVDGLMWRVSDGDGVSNIPFCWR